MTTGFDVALELLMPKDAPQLLRDFATLWLTKRGSWAMPTFEDIDLLDMPWALNTIFVLRRRADGVFAYQVVGEGMSSRLGGSLKGKTAFDVFEHDYAEWTERRWQKAATDRSACFVHTLHQTAAGMPLNAERLLLPLLGPTDQVDSLIGVSVFRGLAADLQITGGAQTILNTIWTPVDQL